MSTFQCPGDHPGNPPPAPFSAGEEEGSGLILGENGAGPFNRNAPSIGLIPIVPIGVGYKQSQNVQRFHQRVRFGGLYGAIKGDVQGEIGFTCHDVHLSIEGLGTSLAHAFRLGLGEVGFIEPRGKGTF